MYITLAAARKRGLGWELGRSSSGYTASSVTSIDGPGIGGYHL